MTIDPTETSGGTPSKSFPAPAASQQRSTSSSLNREEEADGMRQWSLPSAIRRQLTVIVDGLCEESRVTTVMVVTEGGAPLVISGEKNQVDSVAALGVGVYHGMTRLLDLCELGHGRTIYQQGERGGVLMAMLAHGAVIVLILPQEASIGLVRFLLVRELDKLNQLIEEAAQKS